MQFLQLPILLALLFSSSVLACSPGGRSNFFIDLDAEVEWSSDLYPPEIKSISIERGGLPCHFGRIRIELLMPKKSFYKISEVGFYFIHDSYDSLKSIYPDSPLSAIKNENGAFYLEFDWSDYYPKNEFKTSFQLVTVLKDSTISSLSKTVLINE